MKTGFQNGDVSLFMFSLFNDSGFWDFRDSTESDYNPNGQFFLQFARHKCGVSFIDAVADGTVKFHFMDQYSGNFFFKKIIFFKKKSGLTPSHPELFRKTPRD
jgi:hypothetical protein